MTHNDIYNPNHFIELIDELKKMSSLLDNIVDKNVVRRISRHDVLVRGELSDLDLIWNRFLENRQKLIDLEPLRELYLDEDGFTSEEGRNYFARKTHITNSLKVDIKSLFMFSNILIYKIVLLIVSLTGQRKRGVKTRSFSSYLKAIRKLKGGRSENDWEYNFYKKYGEDLERLGVLLGFYRDKFIVHVAGPYQEGISLAVYNPEIKLDHTSWNFDSFDLNKFMELVNQLGDILPKKDKYGRPLDQESDPRPKVEMLFLNLHKINDDDLRQDAERYIKSVGMSSPDIYYLVKTIKDNVKDVISELAIFIKSNYIEKM